MSPADYAIQVHTDSVMAISLLKASLPMYLGVTENQFNSFQQIYFAKESFWGVSGKREVGKSCCY